MSRPAKKPRVEKSKFKAFTTPGEFEDEVDLTFSTDKRKLYVSKNLISIASPVFKAMLSKQWPSHVYKTKTVHLGEKKYDDILELLEHIHPGLQKPITKSNVYVIIPLVQEYKIDGSKPKCAEVLKMLAKERAESPGEIEGVLKILEEAVKYDYTAVIDFTIDLLSKWPYAPFSEGCWITLYETLPDVIKVKILEGRLRFKNNGKIF